MNYFIQILNVFSTLSLHHCGFSVRKDHRDLLEVILNPGVDHFWMRVDNRWTGDRLLKTTAF